MDDLVVEHVLRAVEQVPAGKVVSYGAIAELVGGTARQVGSVMRRLLADRSFPVASVRYPGLPDHPGHDIAAKQMSGFGGMLSFRLTGGEEAALRVCERARVFTLAESLGGVESLIEHPARMTHASAAGSPLEVPADLVRLSVGIEDVEDLWDDLRAALDGCVG